MLPSSPSQSIRSPNHSFWDGLFSASASSSSTHEGRQPSFDDARGVDEQQILIEGNEFSFLFGDQPHSPLSSPTPGRRCCSEQGTPLASSLFRTVPSPFTVTKLSTIKTYEPSLLKHNVHQVVGLMQQQQQGSNSISFGVPDSPSLQCPQSPVQDYEVFAALPSSPPRILDMRDKTQSVACILGNGEVDNKHPQSENWHCSTLLHAPSLVDPSTNAKNQKNPCFDTIGSLEGDKNIDDVLARKWNWHSILPIQSPIFEPNMNNNDKNVHCLYNNTSAPEAKNNHHNNGSSWGAINMLPMPSPILETNPARSQSNADRCDEDPIHSSDDKWKVKPTPSQPTCWPEKSSQVDKVQPATSTAKNGLSEEPFDPHRIFKWDHHTKTAVSKENESVRKEMREQHARVAQIFHYQEGSQTELIHTTATFTGLTGQEDVMGIDSTIMAQYLPTVAPCHQHFFDHRTTETRLANNHIVLTGLPQNYDILLGRGNRSNRHPGNLRFRSFVRRYREFYQSATVTEHKTAITQMLVALSKAPFLYRGRWVTPQFLSFNKELHGWEVVDDEVARQKIAHVLRTKASALKKKKSN